MELEAEYTATGTKQTKPWKSDWVRHVLTGRIKAMEEMPESLRLIGHEVVLEAYHTVMGDFEEYDHWCEVKEDKIRDFIG